MEEFCGASGQQAARVGRRQRPPARRRQGVEMSAAFLALVMALLLLLLQDSGAQAVHGAEAHVSSVYDALVSVARLCRLMMGNWVEVVSRARDVVS